MEMRWYDTTEAKHSDILVCELKEVVKSEFMKIMVTFELFLKEKYEEGMEDSTQHSYES